MIQDAPNDKPSASVLSEIAAEVRAARARRQLTQVELAERAGVSPNRVVEIERAVSDPRFSTLEKVAGALGFRVTLLPQQAA